MNARGKTLAGAAKPPRKGSIADAARRLGAVVPYVGALASEAVDQELNYKTVAMLLKAAMGRCAREAKEAAVRGRP